MRFARLLSPLRILTADLGVFKSCARNSTSASFARSSTAGARSRNFRAPAISPAISSLLARGCTLTRKKSVPLVWFSEISSIRGLPTAFVLHRRLDFFTEDFPCTPGPIGLTQHLARKKNQLRLLPTQNLPRFSPCR